ncbi:MAG: class I SAM-dependent methyltransferase, partial [archaeon]
ELQINSINNLVEIGCGYGRLLSLLSDKGKTVTGIDFSKSLIDKAKFNLSKKKNVKILEMNAAKLNFDDNAFDFVLCLDASFGNMPNIEEQVLKEMKRVCKIGGTLIISVFSENAKKAQMENYKRIGLTNIKDDGIAVHTSEGLYSRRFSKNELDELFFKISLKCKISKLSKINYIAIAKKV